MLSLAEPHPGCSRRFIDADKSRAFRGLSDVSHPLEATLQRLGGDYAGLDRHLLGNFRMYARRLTVEWRLF
jgi:hypothetical protein